MELHAAAFAGRCRGTRVHVTHVNVLSGGGLGGREIPELLLGASADEIRDEMKDAHVQVPGRGVLRCPAIRRSQPPTPITRTTGRNRYHALARKENVVLRIEW